MTLADVVSLLREERERLGLSRAEVARRGGFANESGVRRIERPDSNPTLDTLQRYAGAVGVTLKLEVEGMRVLTFFNHVGGAGKTSSIREVGHMLATSGFRVLLIDMDPQANLTSWLGVRSSVELSQTVYPAIIGEEGGDSFTLPTPLRVHGLDLIPSNINIAKIEPRLVGTIMGVTRLRQAVRKLQGYDFVLIDPPPSLGQLSASAVIAADYIVVPVPTNNKGLEGLATVISMVKEYRQAAPSLRIAFFLVTRYDSRTNHDKAALAKIQSDLPSIAPISSPISARPAIYQDSQASGTPVGVFAKDSEAHAEVRTVTNQLLDALEVNVGV
jgi:chromosome partitioning protein